MPSRIGDRKIARLPPPPPSGKFTAMPAPVNQLVIALAQIPSVVGDIAANAERLRKARAEAAAFGADIVMTPELFLAGYPPEDLVLKPAFQEACRAACEELARETADGGPAMLVGLPWVEKGKLHNAVALIHGGRIEAVRFKVDLPNYGVFDEKRVFVPGPSPGPIGFRGVRIGVPICEDIWGPDPVECILETGGEILLVPNASPYERDKLAIRHNVAVDRVVESGLPLIYLNMVGGQDEVVFEGASFVLNADRSLAVQLPAFRPMVARTVWQRGAKGWICVEGPKEVVEEGDEADYAACVMGLRDYVDNNRFPGVVLGLSGGVNSALCAAMAVDALGAGRVHAVMLPYRFTSNESLSDAAACAEALGVRYDIVPIAEPVEGVEHALARMFAGRAARHHRGEHPEPRARRDPDGDLQQVGRDGGHDRQQVGDVGRLRHALRRHERRLQSDQGPLQDGGVPPRRASQPLEAGRRARARRRRSFLENILVKPPSAELRENQKDEDSLPPYPILDGILHRLVEKEMRVADIVAEGYDPETVRRIERLLYLAEYKRRQSAPGVKVGPKNFGRDRRYPIVNRFRDPGLPAQAPDAAIAPRGAEGTSERFEE